jgi:hypothetical protein
VAVLEEQVQALPDDARLRNALALAHAASEGREEALSQARRATDLVPVERDAVGGPIVGAQAAFVHAWAGDVEGAMERLERLARLPNGFTAAGLRLEPLAQPLRTHPRYERLLELAGRSL